MSTINNTSKNIEVPQNARFVVYKFPGTASTIEMTLLDDTDEVKHHKIPRTWKDIKEAELGGNSYGVVFKNQEHKFLPTTYIIRGELKDILDLDDNKIEDCFEESQASAALASTGLTTYIKAELKNLLAYIAFDPKTMVMIEEGKE